MSLHPNDSEGRKVVKVTFTPVSKDTTDALIVTIRKVSGEVRKEDIPGVISSLAEPATARAKSTMSDRKEKKSPVAQNRQKIASESVDNTTEAFPCMKHAAQNISRKATSIDHEKINLCSSCSKSMLSYIFLVQDFLDSLAREISGERSSKCLQCARQELRDSIASLDIADDLETAASQNASVAEERRAEDAPVQKAKRSTPKHRQGRHRQESQKDETARKLVPPELESRTKQVEFLYNTAPSVRADSRIGKTQSCNIRSVPQEIVPSVVKQNEQRSVPKENLLSVMKEDDPRGVSREPVQPVVTHGSGGFPRQNESESRSSYEEHSPNSGTERGQPDLSSQSRDEETRIESGRNVPAVVSASETTTKVESAEITGSGPSQRETNGQTFFLRSAPAEKEKPNEQAVSYKDEHFQNAGKDSPPTQHSPSLFRDDVDGIVSTLSSTEREIYDSARDGAGWEHLTGPQEVLSSPQCGKISTEAFVTYCRNNAEAIGCLVVGTSLLLCRTSRTLCVLVADGVSTAFREAFSAVFSVVQYVRSFDSLGTTKLALLEQPELGITFDKLNVWRLVQFNKCVYLNPDTLVIQNCDELFIRDELSAVPDIGWPDCFNSGVFVFSPSHHTFWQLMEFAEKQGSYDGGDQGLLNSYFTPWSSDINKKLSFIYNLMANVSYTYTPAFRQFGRDVKIVQFHGSFKPWHVKFFTDSGQVSPSSPVHPTYVQFVHIWLNIFRISVLRLMSQEIKSYAASTKVMCAVEVLRFFPLPTETEAEFFLTPPSVRLKLAERKLQKSANQPVPEQKRRKSADVPHYRNTEEESISADTAINSASQEVDFADKGKESEENAPKPAEDSVEKELEAPAGETTELDSSIVDEVFQQKDDDKDGLPGAAVGNYQRMRAWEQGRMDYEGKDGSENILKRLQFLMSNPK